MALLFKLGAQTFDEIRVRGRDAILGGAAGKSYSELRSNTKKRGRGILITLETSYFGIKGEGFAS